MGADGSHVRGARRRGGRPWPRSARSPARRAPRPTGDRPMICPARSTVTGPCSLTTTRIAVGSSKLYRRADVCRVPRNGSTSGFRRRTRDEEHAELAQRARLVEHRRTVDLTEHMAQRSEVGRTIDAQRRRRPEPLLERRGFGVGGPVDDDRADTSCAQVVHREAQEPVECQRVVRVEPATGPLQPRPDRRLAMPAHAVPPGDAERLTDEADEPTRMTLHDRRPGRFGKDDQVAL